MKKQFVVLMLCLLLAFSLAVTAGAEETDRSFVLTVCTANNTVIEPVRVNYTVGQSVKEALLNSEFEFEGLEESNFIYSIEGVVANYIINYDNGGWSFDTPASEVTAIRIGVNSILSEYSDIMFSLIKGMADYNDMNNHVQNYQPASTAYSRCLYGIRGNGSEVEDLMAELENAICAYESILTGSKYTVTFNATHYSQQLTSPVITMTDTYGNVTTNTGSSIQVVAGDYTFSVSDGGYNRTEGTVKVRANTTISTELPEGEWFGDMYMRSYSWQFGFHEPYRCEQDTLNHKTTFYVDDTAYGYYGTNLVVNIGNVPDEQTTKLRTIYISVDGEDYSNKTRSWSKETGTYGNMLDHLVDQGMQGRTFQIEGQFTDESGQIQIQSYEIEIIRVPTLKDLTLLADGSQISLGNEIYFNTNPGYEPELYAIAFESGTWDYNITTIADAIEIITTPFSSDYTIVGDGVISVPDGTSDHEVVVNPPNGMCGVYSIHITKVDKVTVEVDLPIGTEIVITNNIGSVFAPVNGIYYLVPGESYSCTATKQKYYHTEIPFVASDGLRLEVPEPITDDWLEDIELISGTVHLGNGEYSHITIPMDPEYHSAMHAYTIATSDCASMVYIQADASKGTIYARYKGQTDLQGGVLNNIEITNAVGNSAFSATPCPKFLGPCGYKNDLVIRIENDDNDIKYYQDYQLSFIKKLHLLSLDIDGVGETSVLYDNEGNVVEFDRDVVDYRLTVNRDTETIIISGEFPETSKYLLEDLTDGYWLMIDGKRYNGVPVFWENTMGQQYHNGFEFSDLQLPLNTEEDNETITIQVCHKDPTAIETSYVIHVEKSSPVEVAFITIPADAIVCLINDSTCNRVFDDNGTYMLTPGSSYTYTVTRAGYKGIKESFLVPESGGIIQIDLKAAETNTSIVPLTDVQWPSFRRDSSNNAIINVPTPISGEEAVLYWAKKIGDAWDSGSACSPPIIVGGYLYLYAGNMLCKVDRFTGEIVASVRMAGMSSFAINPPTYADGMIFVGLSNGGVQAFSASTLESLWIYLDPLGGQPNCTITYHNGYVYTGFWVGETSYANLVCLSATDEDPTNPLEKKLSTWTYSSLGGYYWAGSYVCDDYLLVGTDDGYTSYKNDGQLLSLDPRTGKLLDKRTLSGSGDIRSDITQYNGKYYFTSKGGYFYEAVVNESGKIQEMRALNLGGMSTSTPVIYNGRAYVGTCGSSQFNSYSGHKVCVLDVTYWEKVYDVPTQGYPQSSGSLTTFYEGITGKVYVYFFDNFTPGKLRVLEDSPGQRTPSLTSKEGKYNTVYNLFQPYDAQAQFAICSPIIDNYGTLYFKNDSGYLMAVGSSIDHLEITQQPEKLEYQEGEVFDPAGLIVTAHFVNGTSRDVTQYLTWSEEPLTTDDIDFQILYPIVGYQNKIENGVVQAGYEYPIPMASVSLTIEPKPTVVYGDVNSDGVINMWDYRLVIQYYNDEISLTEAQIEAADVDGNGTINMWDYRYIIQYYNDEISKFPVEP